MRKDYFGIIAIILLDCREGTSRKGGSLGPILLYIILIDFLQSNIDSKFLSIDKSRFCDCINFLYKWISERRF
jgi:hypothetical protein